LHKYESPLPKNYPPPPKKKSKTSNKALITTVEHGENLRSIIKVKLEML
jgi:hypothetical protein